MLTAAKPTIPIWLTVAVLVVIIAVPIAVSSEKLPHPEHDDNDISPPVAMGTDGALCESGVSSGFACRNVELLSRIPLVDIGGGSGADSWGWKDALSGRYYALMARSNGTSFVDVTEPRSPVLVGNLASASGSQPWRDVKVYSEHAFIVADDIPGHGMQVFDLGRLRGVVSAQEFSADTTYRNFGAAHNIAINEDSGFAYVVGSDQCLGGFAHGGYQPSENTVFCRLFFC